MTLAKWYFRPLCIAITFALVTGSTTVSAQDVKRGRYALPDRFSNESDIEINSSVIKKDRDMGLRGRSLGRADEVGNDRVLFNAAPRSSNEPSRIDPARQSPFGIFGRDLPANAWAR